MNIPPKVIVVAGPTASGKTRLAIELAGLYMGEIVSADSMQVYRGMDIGTAKADAQEQALAVHHMLDVAEPREAYSVARYVEQARQCCEDILARGKVPIIAGGTGLYIDSLISGRDFADDDGDSGLRQTLSDEYDALGGEEMLKLLSSFDPERAQKLHPGDKRRIVRAIEVYRLTGLTISEHDRRTQALPPRYDAARIILNYADRAELYRNIDLRVDKMASLGLFEEVQALLDADLNPDCTAMQAIGYKEPAMALQGSISREEAIELIKLNSRRYAKRQLTWFGRWEDALRINWQAHRDFTLALRLSTDFLSHRGYHNVMYPQGKNTL